MNIYGIVGWKDSGKTGLVERLIMEFCALGLRVSTIKHAHHNFEVDKPGKDSWRHRKAGAGEILISSQRRWVLMCELGDAEEPGIGSLLEKLSPADLVLVEGYKREAHRKIECHRQATGQPLLACSDPGVRAVASDVPDDCETDRPVFHLDDSAGIARFILDDLQISR